MSIIYQFFISKVISKIGWPAFIVILSIALAGFYYTSLTYQKHKAYKDGYKTATELYEAKLYKALDDYSKLLKEKQRLSNELSDTLAMQQIEYQKEYEKGKEDAKKETDAIIDEYRNRTNSLSIEVTESRTREELYRNKLASATVSVNNAIRRAELSERSAKFLITQARRADNKVRELNMCKKVLRDTRNTVLQYNKLLTK